MKIVEPKNFKEKFIKLKTPKRGDGWAQGPEPSDDIGFELNVRLRLWRIYSEYVLQSVHMHSTIRITNYDNFIYYFK